MFDTQTSTQFDLSGGQLALNFANTVSQRLRPERFDRLPDYRDVVAFCVESGVLSPGVAARLYVLAGRAQGRRQAALRQAVQLREALYEIFSAIAEHRGVPANALATLNVAVQESAAHARIMHTNRGFATEWTDMETNLSAPLWPIARASVDLLTSDNLANLRICDSESCAWLFLDLTKNHRRRWCDMKTCGNRVKARRHYERMKRG